VRVALNEEKVNKKSRLALGNYLRSDSAVFLCFEYELTEMRISPAHNRLHGPMELVESNVARHQNTPPSWGMGIKES